ncbi:hypothetical protein A8F94_02625 [Bacillus sp. FJAT-27225]|uniref:fluoride efflux transporter CrcB n=1 Tax=Bacillus sp. FJAT-27225 TaxID=1743144 RepID=UPI00080C25EE|nr:fluoride efflux transporter CrcB [Bacillus sp. FJAT-27225]OCA90788.1 hypothetical protein A8F94_02625 [Bacillus sp. FJAT-27225]
MEYLFVGIGGAIGSLLRYLFSGLHLPGGSFPFGTLAVNLLGSYFLGWFTSRFISQKKIHPNWSVFFTTGLTGSFTTFSAFCLETVMLVDQGQYMAASFYFLFSLIGGLGFVWIGTFQGKSQVKKAGLEK